MPADQVTYPVAAEMGAAEFDLVIYALTTPAITAVAIGTVAKDVSDSNNRCPHSNLGMASRCRGTCASLCCRSV